MAQGIVELNKQPSVMGLIDHLNPYQFLQPTPTTMCNAEMKNLHIVSYLNLRMKIWLNLLKPFCSIFLIFQIALPVNTSAIEAFHNRQGVCQDHSHVLLQCAKLLGLPARYVSGYLFVPNSRTPVTRMGGRYFWETHGDISNQIFSQTSIFMWQLVEIIGDVAQFVECAGVKRALNCSSLVLMNVS